ncbi:putative serine/threonine-protein kinase MPS1-like protein [Colletotrichum fructicola]|nr:putative serine/threonine-protein kinase MPS1-like protein [Colletotrichum fructicola]
MSIDVMPGFLDFLLTFGLQSDQRGISFSSFREQYALKRSYTKFGISSLGRSGRQYQICYNLKGVTKKSADKEDSINSEFSIRPAVFYHSFDVVGGNSVWIIAKGGTDIYQRFKELTGQDARPEDRSFGSPKECFRSSLSTHLMLCHWSTEDWKGYLKWLEYVVDEQTKRAVLAPTNDGYHYTVYTAADIQRFLSWQERISEVITVLESNVEVMKSLMRFYAKLQSNNDFDLQAVCKDDIEEFNNQLNSVMDDFRMQITRAKALVKLTSDRGELVKQHRLERLNRNMEREAIMVRIVTIVTLIYLPATFVSTFFSTDIIKYQGQNSPQGNFSPIAMERWLQSLHGSSDIREEFHKFIQDEKVCRKNFEKRPFYFPKDITTWLRRSAGKGTFNNGSRLFSAIYKDKAVYRKSFPPMNEVEKNPLVFAILCQMKCGHMVHVFSKSIDDSHLAFPNLTTTYVDIERVLREEEAVLPERYSKTGYKGVIDEFEAQRWAFYPAMDVLRMGEVNIEEKSILPFFYSAPINVGGTAHVHHFKVDVDLVEHPELRAALEPSRKTDTAIGSEYYEFAVKSYFKEWDDIYKGESQAFRGIRGTRDPRAHGVVKYLGEYSRHLRDDVSGPVREDTRHIMLEFGEQDLEEYLAATKPPVRSKEIIATWEGLFKVASTLRTIHQLDHDWDGDVDRYIGLHGDIKPDNILRVRGKFKLADFGFTSFEKSKIGKPQTSSVLGGTRTYGAPERDQMESTGVKVPHTAAIDTWSLGCVFSAMATWVTLGPQDYINYGERRIMAHEKLQKERNRDAAMHLSVCKDAFHDGTRVLQAVLQWHDYLRNSSRRADTITSRVLDLVENDMLVEDPDGRISSADLCEKLEHIVAEARREYQQGLDLKSIMPESSETLEALLELDKLAPSFAAPRSRLSTASTPTQNSDVSLDTHRAPDIHRLSVLRTGRVRKSERINQIVHGKTANREEVLRSDLHGTIFELPESTTQDQQDALSQRRAFQGRTSPLSNMFSDNKLSETGTNTSASRLGLLTLPKITKTDMEQVNSDQNLMTYPKASSSLMGDGSNRPFSHEKEPVSKATRSHGRSHNGSACESPNPLNPMRRDSNDLLGLRLSSSSANESPPYDDLVSPMSPTGHQPLPPSSDDPPPLNSASTFRRRQGVPIVQEYNRLCQEWERNRTKWCMLQRQVPQDSYLAQFISNRDIIFLVDNASSMDDHWDNVNATLLTLAMKIGMLDKDGLDLMFTIGDPCKHNVSSAKEWKIPEKFGKSMTNAKRDMARYPNNSTDMALALSRVFDNYIDYSKKQTLIVMTDGLWEGSTEEYDVDNTISNFIVKLKTKLDKAERRWFSIQFVSFGDDEKALKRLKRLDDELRSTAKEDVVDSKPWHSTDVNMLILGSIQQGMDAQDPSSPPPPSRVTSQLLANPPPLVTTGSMRKKLVAKLSGR